MSAADDPAAQDAALLRLGRALQDGGYRFTTVTPATHARVNARAGNEWARTVEDVFGWSRPFRAGVLPADWLGPMRDAGVLQAHGDGWRSTVRASTLDGALFLHSAYPTSAADAVFFGPDTCPGHCRGPGPDVYGAELQEPACAAADRLAAVLVTATRRAAPAGSTAGPR